MKRRLAVILFLLLTFSFNVFMPSNNVNAKSKEESGKVELTIDGETKNIDIPELDNYFNEDILKQLEQGRESLGENNIQDEKIIVTVEDMPLDENIQTAGPIHKPTDGGSANKYNIYQQLNTKDDYLGTKGDSILNICNRSFNLFIGNNTKWAWKISTLFGIDLSTYKSNLQDGDQIKQHYQYAYTYTYYAIGDNSPTTEYPTHADFSRCTSVMTTYVEVNNYVDYYLIKKDSSGKAIPYRDTLEKNIKFKSEHYDNKDWINKKLSDMYNNNQKYPYSDTMVSSPFSIR